MKTDINTQFARAVIAQDLAGITARRITEMIFKGLQDGSFAEEYPEAFEGLKEYAADIAFTAYEELKGKLA